MMIVHSPQHRESAFVLGGCFVLGCALLAFGFLNRANEAPAVHVHPTVRVDAQPAPVVRVTNEIPPQVQPQIVVNVPKQEAPQVWNITPLPVGGGGVLGNPSSTPAAPPAEVLNEALDRAQWGALLPGPKQ